MSADSSYSLEALERRWQLEKTPPVGLRLAEEYRKKGDLDASIGALTAGLEVYPNHTASRVALSRYLVDGERFAEAVPHLEQIVALDPAHLVANKLLVGAYAGVDRVEDGRDKLAIYEMMAEGDADIEGLRRLLDEAARGPSSVEPELPPAESSADVPTPEPSPERLGAGSPFGGAIPADVREPEDAFAPQEVVDSPATFEGASESPETEPESSDEPFGSLPTLLEIGSDESSAGIEASGDEPFGEQFTTATATHSPEATPVPDPEGIDEDVADELSEPSSSAPAAASATLGQLYKQQGHGDQAREVFEQVLERDPENPIARREVLATDDALSEPASGETSAEGPAVIGSGPSSADSVEQRKEILIAYRRKLRQAVAAGV